MKRKKKYLRPKRRHRRLLGPLSHRHAPPCRCGASFLPLIPRLVAPRFHPMSSCSWRRLGVLWWLWPSSVGGAFMVAGPGGLARGCDVAALVWCWWAMLVVLDCDVAVLLHCGCGWHCDTAVLVHCGCSALRCGWRDMAAL